MRIPLYVLFPISVTIAGSVPPGGPCSASNNTLDPASHKFLSECTDATFCSAASNGSCLPRLCRRDQFAFRSSDPSATSIPSLCNTGFFCPDEGTGCKPQGSVGSACQLNRDEQCAPPPFSEDRSDQVAGSQQGFNGSICLHSFCMYVPRPFIHRRDPYSLPSLCYKGTLTHLWANTAPSRRRRTLNYGMQGRHSATPYLATTVVRPSCTAMQRPT